MKKYIALIIALVLVISMCSCGNSGKDDGKYTVGICQYVQHSALDSATEGFIAALEEGLGKDNVEIINKNASGEQSSCTTIANGFVAQNVDLIMANATPALQACAAATDSIPILGTAVTHYAPALDIENWTGTVGGNISGTSDLADLEKQAAMIKEWFPDCKKVALLYCSSEANSIYQVEEVASNLEAMGIESKLYGFTDTNDVASVVNAACDYCDVMYIPTDNVAASNTEAIANIVYARGIPVIAGEKDTCSGCGIATLSIDYYDLGYVTGQMAVKILKGEAKVSEMPIGYASEVTPYYNAEACEKYGLTPLSGYLPIEE